jgi:hypothetical protein
MKRIALMVTLLMCCESVAFASTVNVFDGGPKEAIVDLEMPNLDDTVNLSIPAECHIQKATVDVAGMSDGGEYPEGVSVMLNDTKLWEFNGSGYGALGFQKNFIDGMTNWRTEHL